MSLNEIYRTLSAEEVGGLDVHGSSVQVPGGYEQGSRSLSSFHSSDVLDFALLQAVPPQAFSGGFFVREPLEAHDGTIGPIFAWITNLNEKKDFSRVRMTRPSVLLEVMPIMKAVFESLRDATNKAVSSFTCSCRCAKTLR